METVERTCRSRWSSSSTSDIQRLPDDSRERPILGVGVPLISIDAMTASAPSKVALALDRMGLKF